MGLPVGVGIAATKTLANHIAKKMPEYAGVCVWGDLPEGDQQRLLQQLPVSEIWGAPVDYTVAGDGNSDGLGSPVDGSRADAQALQYPHGTEHTGTARGTLHRHAGHPAAPAGDSILAILRPPGNQRRGIGRSDQSVYRKGRL
ncbi:protein of unknown function [Acidithiobacillus ferrivorans]|uniref:UmuC domain-containing protein n=1 Tax=Acidithiobacillus ferrivorans TaxID=160808 RepID=A0A060UMT4_9PROT|nr:hypothetical protein AFERRI_370046 [Acidithiobacillus ferrivorans]SMH65730.1 protein of unknown function [Acidithiobacillus ferrivorans]